MIEFRSHFDSTNNIYWSVSLEKFIHHKVGLTGWPIARHGLFYHVEQSIILESSSQAGYYEK
jgi:hypothetical protein